MSEISRAEFDDLMQRNGFVIDNEDYVVCNLCSANCGQCGVGVHQSKCQEYYDTHPEEFKLMAKLKKMPIPSPMVILMTMASIAHTFFQ
ncbi:hypothetical protein FDI21_gp217 [Pseudomonas phage Noxifer]|uniref:Uncharacterized protein n=1 Tax=Pseudomonas phage Noxifer TaxID=2006684 RepID=A0A1Y0SXY7_9CAUD|nr:hypothetical protein FDI21_gp217 [Pseudomonas phage Noxifer]ARV77494.1 hypothetical protein NOXIFER_329 [Pseudomonas phage Noxifer]